jgi:hypothetical protein
MFTKIYQTSLIFRMAAVMLAFFVLVSTALPMGYGAVGPVYAQMEMPAGDVDMGSMDMGPRDESATDASDLALEMAEGDGFETFGSEGTFSVAADMDTQGFADLGGAGTLDMIDTMGAD